MSMLDELGKIGGAIAAVEALEKANPDASTLTKGVAAIAGFEGAGALERLIEHNGQPSGDDTTEDGNPQA